jgi:hypothetical protein
LGASAVFFFEHETKIRILVKATVAVPRVINPFLRPGESNFAMMAEECSHEIDAAGGVRSSGAILRAGDLS